MSQLENYLVTHRKRAGLSQPDTAFLLKWATSKKVARHERFSQQPNLKAVFAYEVLFGASARDLCPGLYQEVKDQTLEQAKQLIKKLRADKLDGRTAQKLITLRRAVKRAERQQRMSNLTTTE